MDALKTTTIEDVELISTGFWKFSTGERWVTTDELQAAVDAQDDPALRTPIVKFGHNSPLNDGTPRWGSIINLRLSANKQTLIGDVVVPTSIAPLIVKDPESDGEAPYSDRSIEGAFDVKTATGTEHKFVLTGLAFLGEVPPAVEDLEAILGTFTDDGEFVAAASSGRAEDGAKLVLAGAVVEKIRLGVWDEIPADDQPWGTWAWVRHLEVDNGSAGFVIVEDEDTAQLYRVPWTVKGDEVEYGEATEVAIEFVAASASTHDAVLRFARDKRVLSGNPASLSATNGSPALEPPDDPEDEVDLAQLREQLGLAEDADEDAVKAALTEIKSKAEKADALEIPDGLDDQAAKEALAAAAAGTKPTEVQLPEGVVAIDKTTLDDLKASAGLAKNLAEDKRVEARDSLIASAVKAGKFAPSRKQHFSELYDVDPEGTKALIEKLEANTIPVEERGHQADPDNPSGEAASYPAAWLPEVQRTEVAS
jgi:hypothetical protein